MASNSNVSTNKEILSFEKMTRPLIPCDLIFIGGRSPCGKTSLLRTLEFASECLGPGYVYADFSFHIRPWHLDLKNKSPLRDMCLHHEQLIASAKLIPDDEINQLVMYYLHIKEREAINEQRLLGKEKQDGLKMVFLSGFPRTKKQVELIESFFRNIRFVKIGLSKERSEELRQLRIGRGENRKDDHPVRFQQRNETYDQDIRPVFEEFASRNPAKVIKVSFDKPLTQKAKVVIREAITCPVVRSSLLSKIEPRNPKTVTKAMRFIAEVEGRPLNAPLSV